MYHWCTPLPLIFILGETLTILYPEAHNDVFAFWSMSLWGPDYTPGIVPHLAELHPRFFPSMAQGNEQASEPLREGWHLF